MFLSRWLIIIAVENSPETNHSYSHVLQKIGILRSFSVGKVITRKEIDTLKKLVAELTKDKEEYNKMLQEEVAKLGVMNDEKNPVPGIIYDNITDVALSKEADKISKALKSKKTTTRNLCFIISSIIRDLKLTQNDFMEFHSEMNDDDEDDDE